MDGTGRYYAAEGKLQVLVLTNTVDQDSGSQILPSTDQGRCGSSGYRCCVGWGLPGGLLSRHEGGPFNGDDCGLVNLG